MFHSDPSLDNFLVDKKLIATIYGWCRDQYVRLSFEIIMKLTLIILF